MTTKRNFIFQLVCVMLALTIIQEVTPRTNPEAIANMDSEGMLSVKIFIPEIIACTMEVFFSSVVIESITIKITDL